MSIARKKGTCIDCPPGTEPRYLIAKRCISDSFHYQKHQKESYFKKKTAKNKAATAAVSAGNDGMTLARWFNDQISLLPQCCENCGDYLNPWAPWSSRAYIAHIVPKRFFLSVQVHPLNRVFLCIDCHTKFDNSLSSEVELMKVYPIAVERFVQFCGLIKYEERKHLMTCFEKSLQ